jgi:hypothetical protein
MAAAKRDHPPPNHAGHLGNANLLATTSHAGLFTSFMGATQTSLPPSSWAQLAHSPSKTITLHQADAKSSNRCTNALFLATF